MSLLTEFRKAYADMDPDLDWSIASARRNLDWCYAEPVSLPEALKAFTAACKSYNSFEHTAVFEVLTKLEEKLGTPLRMTPAREGSVAIYLILENDALAQEAVKILKQSRKLHADEITLTKGGKIRLWWD